MDTGNAHDQRLSLVQRFMWAWKRLVAQLNFYRIHLLVFTFTPLLFSCIFYGANGQNHVDYVDALFNCVSAMTVTGLATVDLSSLTNFQQALLFFQMCIGSTVFVSWIMVYIRVHFFEKRLRHIIESEVARQSGANTPAVDASDAAGPTSLPARLAAMLIIKSRTRSQQSTKKRTNGSPRNSESKSKTSSEMDEYAGVKGKVNASMIRRVDEAPRLVNPQGWISDDGPPPVVPPFLPPTLPPVLESPPLPESPRTVDIELTVEAPDNESPGTDRVDPDYEFPLRRRYHPDVDTQLRPTNTMQSRRDSALPLPRTQTIEFAPHPPPPPHSHSHSHSHQHPHLHSHPPVRHGHARQDSFATSYASGFPRSRTFDSRGGGIARSHSFTRVPTLQPERDIGFGGFPWPTTLLSRLVNWVFPGIRRRLQRTLTVPRTATYMSGRSGGPSSTVNDTTRPAYLSFDTVVGHNSAFDMLSDEQLEELGGVEYRALHMLLWVIGLYHVGCQLLSALVIAPYISTKRWTSAFNPPLLHRHVHPVWFTAFQAVSAYTNTGMSLSDQSMIPFQTAYGMVVFMIFLILAGNTAFPIFLRLVIWIMSKFVRATSKSAETIQFLLDHPRRCFVYLFPSHQTWFLLTVLIALNSFDWAMFLILDIGNPEIESVPLGTRFVIGLLQALAVRAAGFGTISVSALAPAVKVLYVTMMYVSVYPIALSVRTTNVYEEKSLGIFESDESEKQDAEPSGEGHRGAVWGRYLAWHARKQLAFDMWWIGLALFLICIVERSALQNRENAMWFNIFNIVFELVSAYGTVGLSLGLPTANYSFSGALRPLSKLIICLVMIRGRHRGLPVAIDRAVMLPHEFTKHPEQPLPDDYVVVGDDQSTATVNRRIGRAPTRDVFQLGQRPKSLPPRKSTL